MRIKTFYSRNMKAALQLIKEQLGPDALIVSSREFPPPGSGRPATGIEVVAAIDEDSRGLHEPQPPMRERRSPGRSRGEDAAALAEKAGDGGDTFSLRSRRAGAEGIGRRPAASSDFLQSVRFDAAAEEESVLGFRRFLLDREISESVAEQLLEEARMSVAPDAQSDRGALQKAVAAAACSRIAESGHTDGMPQKRIVVLMGPTGVGKTTSIAKLAARLAMKRRKKVALLSLDTYRIGAIEQLRTYAGLMGIPFRFVRETADLGKAIDDCSQRDFILIDTIGHGPRNLEPLRELGRLLECRADVERHLVLSATTKPRDLPDIAARFECCNPDHLLFTKLDETTTLGPILNELVRTGKPLAYYSDGQRVPEDFHAAGREQLVDLILN